jgi:hypothetical protein
VVVHSLFNVIQMGCRGIQIIHGTEKTDKPDARGALRTWQARAVNTDCPRHLQRQQIREKLWYKNRTRIFHIV